MNKSRILPTEQVSIFGVFRMPKLSNKSIQVALMLLVLCACQDFYNFWIGKSWTPFQYESIATLLIIGQNRFIKSTGLVLFLFLSSTKIIFFQFGIDFFSIQESTLGVVILVSLFFIFIFIKIHQWRQIIWGLFFYFLFFIFILFIDKKITNDMFSSSYIFGLITPKIKITTPSNNKVYKMLKDRSIGKKGTILVVWESLGVPLDKKILATLQREIDPATMETITHEGGSTVAAEIRYLCGVNGTLQTGTDCLPNHDSSTAMHGNTLSYFNRYSLYRNIGFEKYLGRSDLGDLEVCHFAYTAICDEQLLDQLLKTVKQEQCKGFYYALTIDSHFPYLKYSDHPAQLISDVKIFLQKYEALRVELPDCELIVVGDHPPPLSNNFEAKSVLLIRR